MRKRIDTSFINILGGLCILLCLAVVSGCTRDRVMDADFARWEAKQKNGRPKARATLTYGLVPSGPVLKVIQNQDALVAYLSTKIRVDVQPMVFRNYEDLIVALATGKVDFAKINTVGYVKANARGGAECLLQRTRNGKPVYYGSIITRADSGIRTLAGLRGHSFTFVDRNSTSGYLFPRAVLLRAGIDPESDLKYSFSGKHNDSLLKVLLGHTDAAAVHKGSPASLKDDYDISQLRVIESYGPMPEEPIAVRRGLPAAMKKKIAQAFLSVASPQARSKFFEKDIYAYIECDDANYNEIRDLLKYMDSSRGETP